MRVGKPKSFCLYAQAGALAPYDRIYGRPSPRPAYGLARYLPETPGGGQTQNATCPLNRQMSVR